MELNEKPKSTLINRTMIKFLTVIMGVLIFWVLGFLVKDIKTIDGPDYSAFKAIYEDKTLSAKNAELERNIQALQHEITTYKDTQSRTEKNTKNLQNTINQLLEIQKLDLQKQTHTPNREQTDFYSTLNGFLENQASFQELGAKIAAAITEKERLEAEKKQITRQISEQMEPARTAHDNALRAHNLKLAFYQLLLLIPLLVISALLMLKKRDSIYFPFFMATAGAVLVKVGLVAHEYFPTEYFKYILIGVLLVVVGKILHYFINTASAPKLETLLKQYKEAYSHFLCPVCEHPICMGPRRFLHWTRRSVSNIKPAVTANDDYTPYTCPACGTGLFESCPSCDQTRHSLLPHCEHCGDEKPISVTMDQSPQSKA